MSPESDNPAVKKLLEGYKRLNGQKSTDGRISTHQHVSRGPGLDTLDRTVELNDVAIKENAARRIGRNDPDSIKY